MSFQSYLDNIKAKTGKTPDDFRKLAHSHGFLKEGTKAGVIVSWLKNEFGLGHGHAMAICRILKPPPGTDALQDPLSRHFSGRKEHWRATFDLVLESCRRLGPFELAPTGSYISLVKGASKFAVISFTAQHMDIGIKLKSAPPTLRFQQSGTWNAMVTHKVRISKGDDLDDELVSWLGKAYHQS